MFLIMLLVYKNCSDAVDYCEKYLEIIQDDRTVKITMNLEVEINGRRYHDSQLIILARKYPDLTVRIIGQSVVVKSPKYHYDVIWNVDGNVRIGVCILPLKGWVSTF